MSNYNGEYHAGARWRERLVTGARCQNVAPFSSGDGTALGFSVSGDSGEKRTDRCPVVECDGRTSRRFIRRLVCFPRGRRWAAPGRATGRCLLILWRASTANFTARSVSDIEEAVLASRGERKKTEQEQKASEAKIRRGPPNARGRERDPFHGAARFKISPPRRGE